jgi:hypothetical protein
MPSLAKSHRKLVAIVNIANALTPSLTLGLPHLEGRFVAEEAFRILNLNEDSFERLKKTLQAALDKEKRIEEVRTAGSNN